MNNDFLFELGTEELPPTALRKLVNALVSDVRKGLSAAKLNFDDILPYATPRRLAFIVKNLADSSPVEEKKVWGPPAKIAFDGEGKPTKAAEAFAKKNGITPDQLATENDGKVDKLVVQVKTGGESTVSLLEAIVNTALANLPIPKRMRWGINRHEFVRPVHWLVMLYGGDVVDASLLGLKADRLTRGHRFHYDQTLSLNSADDYVSELKDKAYVLADQQMRKELVREQVIAAAQQYQGVAVIDEDLLDEVSALVEWPVALAGGFDERFLEVPAEALISSMKSHQKYFHVVDQQNRLLPYFITVSNIASMDEKQVVEGNERVIRPRLADAAFFFETDKKTTLAAKREKLKTVTFQAKLGSVYDKTERVSRLAGKIAEQLALDPTAPIRAGQLCKADLVSEMVFEFADMQGIAGQYYAKHDGEAADVAAAMNEHYMPRFAGDDLPQTETGALLALADRLDTLVGIFGIGEQPTGSKDPFALRRASLGVLRLLVEQQRDLDLRDLIDLAYQQYEQLPEGESVVDALLAYMLERFRAWYEEQSINPQVFQAVDAKGLSKPIDIDKRVQAVNYFYQLPEAESLAAANKRVSNILSKVEGAVADSVDTGLLKESAEQALAQALAAKQEELSPLFAEREYQQALTALASLKETIDSFFDSVMVMTDDEPLKNNRLALLQQLRNLFLQVADISLLAVTK